MWILFHEFLLLLMIRLNKLVSRAGEGLHIATGIRNPESTIETHEKIPILA